MCVGFESLVRWTRNGEPVSPVTFIPIAEELGLIEPLGTWVLQQACRTFADWQRRFPDGGPRLHHRQRVEPAARAAELPARRRAGGAADRPEAGDLRVEITETALMDSPGEAAVRAPRAARLRREDLSRRLRDRLFVAEPPAQAAGGRAQDRSLVREQPAAARIVPAIVESILALARTLNTSVVAEGIESEVQARELERLGCTHAQGYLFSRRCRRRRPRPSSRANRPLGPKGLAAAEPTPLPVAYVHA